ncbi:MAG: RtcB family protein [Thiohalocapsa sp.]|jgi:tRNA-splicing ligase RtcB|uniref:RtcB family protein n=1 Tax=Thiohalocapsa sp. TaxID=2497641 RepID=UPI0025FD3066|nr:RtcB family protein [Thiohalocapsa sp.]MCG6941401.1 RtcB family protein [Thiohalocapsa sp.]
MTGLMTNFTRALTRISDTEWRIAPQGAMRVPVVLYASEALVRDMDDKVLEQAANVATLPGIVGASYAMPDAHWGYGFPIGGVAAFDADDGGVVSGGGVGFDISCGVRTLHTGLDRAAVMAVQQELANALYYTIPVGVGSTGAIRLDRRGMDAMLTGGAAWAVREGYGRRDDLERIEERGCMAGADPDQVSEQAKKRQQQEMGTLGSGNHYLEVQAVTDIYDPATADAFALRRGDVTVSIHCGSRGLGHQIGTDYLKRMAVAAAKHGITLPDRELACAPIDSELGRAYLGAMRAGINCALANRQILTHLARRAFTEFFGTDLALLYDVSHNTCKLEEHVVDGRKRKLYVHRKGATRAFGPRHPDLPADLRDVGQPVLIGGTMGTASYILVGGNEPRPDESRSLAFASACHGAGRALSRRAATKRWHGRAVQDELAHRGIVVRSPSARGLAEEAPGAYKDVSEVVLVAERAGLARRVARLEPLICIKG